MVTREENRNTGRTTGLMLKALAEAVLSRGKEIEFIDHSVWSHAKQHGQHFCQEIRVIADRLYLENIHVLLDKDGRVFVRSDFKTKKGKTNEPA